MSCLVSIDKVFGYGDEGCDDYGWGCVYRGIQTIRRVNGLPHLTVPEMRAKCGLLAPTDSVQQLWIEPGDARKHGLLPAAPTHVAYIPQAQDPKAFLRRGAQRTAMDDFDHVLRKREEFEAYLTGALEAGQPVLIDDTYASFVVSGLADGYVLIADPHTATEARRRRRIKAAAFFSKGWIAYSLIKRKEAR